MSSSGKKSPHFEDLISTEDDTLGSSISLSISENSICIKEKSKFKDANNINAAPVEQSLEGKWWLKKPEATLAVSTVKFTESAKHIPILSPDISSSMKEFLEKEKLCKSQQKSEEDVKDKDDTLCDVLASVAFDKYPSDFENATDEDIGSIFEEMNKIAGTLSSNSAQDQTKSGNNSRIPTEEEKSMEELLEEAEKLVKKNSSSLSKSGSKSDTLVLDSNDVNSGSLERVRQLEADIFQMIEDEVHKETEKIRKSPRNEENRRDSSPAVEVLSENINNLMPPKSLELQRKKFEEQKVEISSSSDLDDPIEKHSKSEDLRTSSKSDSDKESIQKEIIDVDKDFFENLLKKTKERAEGGMSGSSSFGQEDFSHFLKLLQGQSDKKELESKESNSLMDYLLKPTNSAESTVESMLNDGKTPEFPEKEISEILKKELHLTNEFKLQNEVINTDFRISNVMSKQAENKKKVSHGAFNKDSAKRLELNKKNSSSVRTGNMNAKRVDSQTELYTVDLTPRLELFADAIPKLLAEKSNEKLEKDERPKEVLEDMLDKNIMVPEHKPIVLQSRIDNLGLKSTKNVVSQNMNPQKTIITKQIDRPILIDNKTKKKDIKMTKSKSSEQICKAPSNLKSSLENIKSARSVDISKKIINPLPKPKIQPKPVTKYISKMRIPSKPSKDLKKTGSTSSLPSAYKILPQKSPSSAIKTMAGGDNKCNLAKTNWEFLCQEERNKNSLLKQQLESEIKMYKSQMESMRITFEKELFTIKKENIILKAKVDELSLNERRIEINPKNDTKILLLENELEKQESMIRVYETENKKLLQETKRMQEEMKNIRTKQKNTTPSVVTETQQFTDRIKDLEEETLKLNLEVSELRQKNADYLMKNDDLNQQNDLLKDEVEIFKDQLRTKNNFITERLQAMTTAEMELKKQVEELTIKLSSKTEQLRITKLELEKIQQNALPLEKELLESRVKESNLQEKLQVAKSHVEREKQLTQKLKDQVIVDNKRIMDLNRQVREMERILKRKNPDSVSALILTANSEQDRIGDEKVKLLEDRIAFLENELKSNEDSAQQKLLDFQIKFSEMKEKYTAQITELESKLMQTNIKEQKVRNEMFTQTVSKMENKSIQTYKSEEKVAESKDEKKDQRKIIKQNVKEDAHLLATIRGLKLELSNKEKTILKVSKEFQELQKTNKRLQKEREKFLNDKKTYKNGDLEKAKGLMASESRLLGLKGSEGNDQNSNVYQNGHVSDPVMKKLSTSNQKLYDPLKYTDNHDAVMNKRLTEENEILKDELNKMNKDFMALKNKRLHDLNLLQEEHEREMANLVKEYSIKFGDSKTIKLQSQLNKQVAIISHLKQQVDNLRDYKEQVIVLKAERDHLENKVKTLNEKVKYLSTPGTEQLQLLQDKITILQQRHESREMTLQNLVRDLLRSRTQCKDCKGEKRQLCYFRQELDHILGMLQEIANV